MDSRVTVIATSSGWADPLCEAGVSGHKETGLNYCNRGGCACHKPEIFVCSETVNLPGEQHRHMGGSWDGGRHLEASATYSRINIRHQSKSGTKRIWRWEVSQSGRAEH